MARQSTRPRRSGGRARRPARDAPTLTLRCRTPSRETPLGTLLRDVAKLVPGAGTPKAWLADGVVWRARVARGRFDPVARLRDAAESLPPGTAIGLAGPVAPSAFPGDRASLVVPALPWPRGDVDGFRFEVVDEAQGWMRVDVTGSLAKARRWFAAAGWPVAADLEHGGVVAGGVPGIGPAGEALRWPDAPAASAARRGTPPAFRISRASARIVGAGHPWVLADAETDDVGRFPGGGCVRLVHGERAAGLAWIDGDGSLVARSVPSPPGELDGLVRDAIARRATLLDASASTDGTDAMRLVHGEADGLPGVHADRLGALLRVQWLGRAALPWRRRIVEALLRGVPAFDPARTPVVEVTHLRKAPAGRFDAVVQTRGTPIDPESTRVREAGLSFRIDPGLAEPSRPHPGVGFFADQRANRDRVARRTRRGGRYLNLFAHTGSFSARLLAAGAGEVWSVDLSAPYLDWLEENLRANGLDESRHHAVRQDVRHFLDAWPAGEPVDGIVLDPPTAAAAGRSFWSVERGLPALVSDAFERLAPGGFLLVCRNDLGRRAPLPDLLRDALGADARVGAAGPSLDFPVRAGFPEGDSFDGAWVERAR